MNPDIQNLSTTRPYEPVRPTETRRSRGWRRILVSLLVLAVLLLGAYALALGPWLESFALARLGGGSSTFDLEVRSATWSTLDVRNFELDDGDRLRIENVTVDYDVQDLLAGYIRNVSVVGARWDIRWTPEGLDLGFPTFTTAGDAQTPEIRVGRIELESSTLLVRRGSVNLRVGVDGFVVWRENDRLDVDLALRLPGLPVRVRAELPAPGAEGVFHASIEPIVSESFVQVRGTLRDDALVRIEGEFRSQSAPGAAPFRMTCGARIAELDALLGGYRVGIEELELALAAEIDAQGRPTSVQARASGGPSRLADVLTSQWNGTLVGTFDSAGVLTHVGGHTTLHDLGWGDHAVEDLELRAELEVDDRYAPQAATGTLRIDALQLGDATAQASLKLAREGPQAVVTGSIAAPSWQLEHIRVELPGAPGRWLESDLPVSASADWSHAGDLGPAGSLGPSNGSIALRSRVLPEPAAPSTWLQVDDLQLKVSSVMVRAPRISENLSVAGSLQLRGAIGPDFAEVDLSPTSRLQADLSDGGRLTLQPDPLAGQAGKITLDPSSPATSFELEVPKLDILATLPARTTQLGSFEGLRVSIPLTVEAAPNGPEVGLVGPATFEAESVTLPGDPPLSLSPLAIEVAGEARIAPRTLDARGTWNARLLRPVEISHGDSEGQLEQCNLQSRFGLDSERTWFPSSVVELSLPYWNDAQGVQIEGVRLRTQVPFGPVDPNESTPGALTVASVHFDETHVAGPGGSIQRTHDELSFTGEWTPTSTVSFDLEASIDASTQRGRARAEALGASLVRGDLLSDRVLELGNVELEADFDTRLDLEFGVDEVDAQLALQVREGSLTSADETQRLEGIELDLTLADAVDLRSEGPARLSWSGGRSGELPLGPGDIPFALEGWHALHVLGVDLATAGTTRFWTQGFRIDPFEPAVGLHLFCQDVDLEEWLGFLSSGRAEGHGRLNGRIALDLNLAQRPPFHLSGGYLSSVGPGNLQLNDEEVVRHLLENSFQAYQFEDIDLSQLMLDRVVGALSDFDYQSLQLKLLPQDDDITLRAEFQGQGAQIEQEISMDANFNGFGSFLTFLLKLDRTQ